jgi:hypothetical protein
VKKILRWLSNLASPLQFVDISSESRRRYVFPGGHMVAIERPVKLAVSASGGHRILDSDGTGHYVPSGWIHLSWETFLGKEPFVK